MYSEVDWRARDDAETLKRAQVIKSDSERLVKAQEYLRESIEESKAVLKGTPIPETSRRRTNPATISKLNRRR